MSASEREPAAGGAGRHGLAELIAERRAKATRLREDLSDRLCAPEVVRERLIVRLSEPARLLAALADQLR